MNTLNGKHMQLDTPKPRRTALPVVAVAAVIVIAAAILLGLGFAIGRNLDAPQQPTKQAGPAFDRTDYRLAGEAFVRELP